MRKVHYRVVLDVSTTEDDQADGMSAIKLLSFWPEYSPLQNSDLVDIQDVSIKVSR